jgi:hypothetical protein
MEFVETVRSILARPQTRCILSAHGVTLERFNTWLELARLHPAREDPCLVVHLADETRVAVTGKLSGTVRIPLRIEPRRCARYDIMAANTVGVDLEPAQEEEARDALYGRLQRFQYERARTSITLAPGVALHLSRVWVGRSAAERQAAAPVLEAEIEAVRRPDLKSHPMARDVMYWTNRLF